VIQYTGGRLPYTVTWYDKRRERQRSFPTKRLAEEFEKQRLDEKHRRESGLPLPKRDITLNELCELYLAGFKEETRTWVTTVLRKPCSHFGRIRIRHLAGDQINSWLAEQPLSPSYKRHIVTYLRGALETAIEWHYLDRNPLTRRAIKLPPNEPVRPILPFESWDEVLAVAGTIGDLYGPHVRFACATGMRISEWCALEWRVVDRTNAVAHVLRTYTPRTGLKDTGKRPGSLRPVALSVHALAALDDRPTPLKQTQLVLPAPDGSYLSRDSFATAWYKALAAVDLERRPPSQMRHTYATLALAQGAALDWISDQMGHRNVSTTRKYYARYLKVYDDRQLAILNQIGTADDDHQSENRQPPGR
jgi:integrase